MKSKIRQGIEKLKKIAINQSYQNYIKNFNKNSLIPLPKKTKIKIISGLLISIGSLLFVFSRDAGEPKSIGIALIMFVVMLLIMYLILSSCMEIKVIDDMNQRNLLSEKEFEIEKLKNKTLTIDEIKQFEQYVLLIKNQTNDDQFKELLLKTEKISGKKLGNAYFYYILFLNYEKNINEIIQEDIQKNEAFQQMKILNEKEKAVMF